MSSRPQGFSSVQIESAARRPPRGALHTRRCFLPAARRCCLPVAGSWIQAIKFHESPLRCCIDSQEPCACGSAPIPRASFPRELTSPS